MRRLYSLQEPGESDAAFARRLGLQPQTFSNYKNGHHELSLRTALRVHRVTGLSLDWLVSGREPKYVDLEATGDPPAPDSSSPADRARDEESSAGPLEAIRRFIQESSGDAGLEEEAQRELRQVHELLRDLVT